MVVDDDQLLRNVNQMVLFLHFSRRRLLVTLTCVCPVGRLNNKGSSQ